MLDGVSFVFNDVLDTIERVMEAVASILDASGELLGSAVRDRIALHLLPTAPAALKHWTPVLLHLGSTPILFRQHQRYQWTFCSLD